MKSITLSVRRLAEFLLVRGSIDARAGRGFDRALEGSRIHRKLQRKAAKRTAPKSRSAPRSNAANSATRSKAVPTAF